MKDKLAEIRKCIQDWFFSVKDNIDYQMERIVGCWEYLCFFWTHNSYREWDYEYLYEFMVFKLERMAEQLKKDDFVEGSEETYKQIIQTLNYYQVYMDIETGETTKLPCSDEQLSYAKLSAYQTLMWNKFHDSLRDNSRRWWS